MDEAGRDKLWQQYSKTHDTELRDELILEYAQLVKLVAGRLSMYLGYNVEYDDLVGYGIFGLIDAIDKYDYGKNVKFETISEKEPSTKQFKEWIGFHVRCVRNRKKLMLRWLL